MNQRLKFILWVGLFFVFGFSIFAPSFDNQFIMDDQTQIVSNPQVHDLGAWADLFTGSTIHEANKAKGSGIYYKPIMLFVYSLTWAISHDPMAFHIVQLLFHILNALMVWGFFAAFIETDLALFAGLVFLVHPFNSETVIYAADLQDVLYEFFGLLGLLVLTKLDWGRWRWPAFITLSLLSLLSKESGLLFLFISGVFIWLFQKRDRWRFLASAHLSLLVYLILRVGIAGLDIQHDQMTKIGRASFVERIWTAPLVMSHYFYRFFVPVHFTTNQDWIVASPEFLQFFLPLIFLLLVAGFTIALARKWGQPFFWLMAWWLAAGLGFHSHLIEPLDGTISPRWFYFPMIGLLGLLLVAFQRYRSKHQLPQWLKTAALPGLGVLLMALAVLSSVRAQEWFDNDTLFAAEIERLPDSYVVQNNYGTQLFLKGKPSEAKKYFEESIRLAPQWTINWNNLGAVQQHEGNLKDAENSYLHAINNGSYYLAFENYVMILVLQNRTEEAKKFLVEKALPQFPEDPKLQQIAHEIFHL